MHATGIGIEVNKVQCLEELGSGRVKYVCTHVYSIMGT